MRFSRRNLISGTAGSAAGGMLVKYAESSDAPGVRNRRFSYVQIDVFTSQRLEGNQLVVFTDARGAFGEMTQLDPVFGTIHDTKNLVRADHRPDFGKGPSHGLLGNCIVGFRESQTPRIR